MIWQQRNKLTNQWNHMSWKQKGGSKKTFALTDDEASKPFKRLFKDSVLNLGVLSQWIIIIRANSFFPVRQFSNDEIYDYVNIS